MASKRGIENKKEICDLIIVILFSINSYRIFSSLFALISFSLFKYLSLPPFGVLLQIIINSLRISFVILSVIIVKKIVSRGSFTIKKVLMPLFFLLSIIPYNFNLIVEHKLISNTEIENIKLDPSSTNLDIKLVCIKQSVDKDSTSEVFNQRHVVDATAERFSENKYYIKLFLNNEGMLRLKAAIGGNNSGNNFIFIIDNKKVGSAFQIDKGMDTDGVNIPIMFIKKKAVEITSLLKSQAKKRNGVRDPCFSLKIRKFGIHYF